MKKLFYLFIVAMCATVFTACSKDDDSDPFDTGENGVIIMTTEEEDVYLYIGTAKAGEIITVDWGDGQTQEYKVERQDDGTVYATDARHIYTQSGTHTIKITGLVTSLDCGWNYLTTLDVSGCTSLTGLGCSSNDLTSLDISKCTKLTVLNCDGNELTSLDVSKNTALTVLNCDGNNLTSLDVSKCTALTVLWCPYNKLASLNISGCTALKELVCYINKLTSLDVSKHTALTYLRCSSNDLTSLDVSKNTALIVLECGGNQLTSLDVSKNKALGELSCRGNELTSTVLNKIFTDLSQGKTWVDEEGDTRTCQIDISNNPGSDTCNKSIAENKGWIVSNH